MNSNLDTARRMKAISEMTLQTAASKNKDFEICQEDIIQKVSKIAVNVPATERIFNNLCKRCENLAKISSNFNLLSANRHFRC
ncbi:Hypothetical predicted protein [Cloeon dipterum]|uniref:Uncharacterized protein n=1 Tax=Cloeon dipterum TaxID=197152 RepID=A0A8S1DYX2_9INSE|nr:Hypothetical predicted protein [Cloeon dipterum]